MLTFFQHFEQMESLLNLFKSIFVWVKTIIVYKLKELNKMFKKSDKG